MRAIAAAELADRLVRTLTEVEGRRTLMLHPFLMLDDAWWQGVRRLPAHIARLDRREETWVGPGGDFARRLQETMRP